MHMHENLNNVNKKEKKTLKNFISYLYVLINLKNSYK